MTSCAILSRETGRLVESSPRTAGGHMESLVLDDYHVLIPRRIVGLIHSWDRGGLRSYI